MGRVKKQSDFTLELDERGKPQADFWVFSCDTVEGFFNRVWEFSGNLLMQYLFTSLLLDRVENGSFFTSAFRKIISWST